MAKLNENNIIYDGTKKISIDGIDVYTSNETDNKLIVKADVKDIYNKSEVDNKLSNKVDRSDLSNYASKSELKNKVDDIVIGNLGNTGFKNNDSVEEILIEVKSELDKKQSRSDSGNIKNDISKINTIIGNIRQTGFSGNTIGEQLREAKVLLDGNRYTRSSSSIDFSNYYTKSEVYNKEEVDQKIAYVSTGGSVDLSNYATKQELANKANVSDLNAKLDESIYNSEKINYATKQELVNKADTSEISRIDLEISSINSDMSTKADNVDYQATKRNLVSLESKIGNLQGTGLTGTTVTELLTDVKTRIDGVQSGSGSGSGGTSYSFTAPLKNTSGTVTLDLETSDFKESNGKLALSDTVKQKLQQIGQGGVSTAPSTVDMSSIKESIFAGKIEVFKRGEHIDGLDPVFYAENGPYFRIPSVEITDNGTIYVVADCRDKPTDQVRICIVAARSIDGGKTFEKKIIMNRDLSASGADETVSRVMDPTTLHTGGNEIFVLAGRWVKGSSNWGGGDTRNNWTAAATCIINDANWQSGNFQVDYNFNPSTNRPAGLQGFLGGVDRGLVSSSGKWVMPVQLIDSVGCRATIMYKDPAGDWQWATNFTTTTNSGECSIVEIEPDVFEMILRKSGGKKRYRIENFGTSAFQELSSPALPGDTNDQGSFIHFKTKSGAIIDLITNAQNETGVDYIRDQITMYHFDRLSQPQSINAVRVFEYEKAGAPTNSSGGNFQGTQFGGYSSLCYKYNPRKDGEMLLVVVEDDVGVSMFDATDLLAGLENVYFSHSALSQDEVSNLKTIPTMVDTKVNAWPDNFTSFIDTHTIPTSKSFDVIGSSLTSIGSLAIGGDFLDSSGAVDSTKVSVSDLAPGLLHIVNPNTNGGAVIRGNVSVDSSATVLSIAMTFCFPTTSATRDDYCPLVRFFDNATSVVKGNNKGGLEIKANGELYVTKGSAVTVLEKDRIYNIVAEYDSAGAKVYLDGELVNTQAGTSLLGYLKSATYMCIAAQGDGGNGTNVKRTDMHIGNIAIYSRQLTDNEKRNVNWVNGSSNKTNSFNRFYQIEQSKADKEELDKLRAVMYPLIYASSTIPAKDKLVVNMNSDVFKTGVPNNCDKLGLNSTISGNKELLSLISGGNTTITSFGASKTTGFASGERAYNPEEGFWWIGKDIRQTWFDLTSLDVNSTEGFSIEIQFKAGSCEAWASPFGISSKDSLGTDPSQTTHKQANNIRLEVDNTATNRNLCCFSMQNADYTPQNATVGQIAAAGSDNLISVVMTLNGRDLNLYRDYNSSPTYTGTLGFDLGVIKWAFFNRGSNGSIKFADMKIYKFRVWKGAVLSGSQVQELANN